MSSSLTHPLQDELRGMIAGIAGISPDFPADVHLYLDLAIPSIGAMQLLTELEERYGVQIPDDRFIEATSLNALTALMEDLLRP